MTRYTVNFYDVVDMLTWVVTIEADSDAEAYRIAEQYRLSNAMSPDETEVYAITHNQTGDDVYRSSRFNRSAS